MKNKKIHILIAQEDSGTRKLYEHFLKAEGYQVTTADSGTQALTFLGDKNFDLLIMDLKMGDMDTLEILPFIREKQPSIPVVLVSGYYLHLMEAVQQADVDSHLFLAEPLTLLNLKKVVRRILGVTHSSAESQGVADLGRCSPN